MNLNARDLYLLWSRAHEALFPGARGTTPWEEVDTVTQEVWAKYAQNLRDELRKGPSE